MKAKDGDRRIEPRFLAMNRVSVATSTQKCFLFEGLTRDLSLHGMRLEFAPPLAIGSKLSITLDLGRDRQVELEGQVRWVGDIAARESAMGVEFQFHSSRGKRTLSQYLANRSTARFSGGQFSSWDLQ